MLIRNCESSACERSLSCVGGEADLDRDRARGCWEEVYSWRKSYRNSGVEEVKSMHATATQVASDDVRAFIQEYFDAWKGTDEDRILAYYSDDVALRLPTGILEGKAAVRDSF